MVSTSVASNAGPPWPHSQSFRRAGVSTSRPRKTAHGDGDRRRTAPGGWIHGATRDRGWSAALRETWLETNHGNGDLTRLNRVSNARTTWRPLSQASVRAV